MDLDCRGGEIKEQENLRIFIGGNLRFIRGIVLFACYIYRQDTIPLGSEAPAVEFFGPGQAIRIAFNWWNRASWVVFHWGHCSMGRMRTWSVSRLSVEKRPSSWNEYSR